MKRENSLESSGLEWIELDEEQEACAGVDEKASRRKAGLRRGRSLSAAAAALGAILLIAALAPSLSSCSSNAAATAGLVEKTAENVGGD